MRRFILLLALSSSAFAPAPPPRPSPQETDLKAMQGAWVVDYFIGNGERMASQESIWTVAGGGRVTTTFAGMPSTRFVLELGRGRVPRPVDWVIDGGERKLGRYRLDGDRLEVGIGPVRPPDLSGKGSGVAVWVLKRKKP